MGRMVSILEKLFSRRGAEAEPEALGCDMVPSPSVLATLFDPATKDALPPARASTTIGPFETMAQAPIRDS